MFKRIVVLMTVLMASVWLAGLTAFAEGEFVCNGRLMGEVDSANTNAGTTYFDAHNSTIPGDPAPRVADLSIVGLADGLAPEAMEDAACISKTGVDEPIITDQTYELQGWSWNDNLGFISYFCDGTTNPKVDSDPDNGFTPQACGAITYGVKISDDSDLDNIRALSGEAWNDTFGYIKFDDDNPFDAFPYGVTLDMTTNKLDGFAYTDAGVYMDFTGIEVELPDTVVPITSTDYCADHVARPYCLVANPDPSGFAGISASGTAKIADGEDFYQMDLYLYDHLTGLPMTPADVVAQNFQLQFFWKDTVKRNQLFGQTGDFSAVASNAKGAILSKPIIVDKNNFVAIFIQDLSEPGHYTLRTPIRSIAPTSNENISLTTSTEPAFIASNEKFFAEIDGVTNLVFQSNNLILKRVEIKKAGVQVPQSPVYPGGRIDLHFRFRPALELATLYANDFDDSILAIRGIPTTFVTKIKRNGSLSATDQQVDFKLAYDATATLEDSSQTCTVAEANGFDFTFVKDLFGLDYAPGEGPSEFLNVDITLLAAAKEMASVAILSLEGEACSQAVGPSLYSIVHYKPTGELVKYYSNKLPRIVSEIANPSVVVHGNIYAPKALSPNAEVEVQETGNVDVSLLKNVVYKNIVDKISSINLKPSISVPSRTCVVSKLGATVNDITVEGNGCVGTAYKVEEVEGQNGKEKVLIFEGVNVSVDLNTYLSSKWSLIATRGNVFIDGDIYPGAGDSDQDFSIVAIGPYSSGCSGKGNIYIGSDVNNIQANMVADCSVISYRQGDHLASSFTNGLYNWADSTDRINTLNKQLLIQGSIASFNTVGGADDEASYLRDGFGNVITLPASSEDRMKAQQYDLNYLRLFRLGLDINANGWVRDYKCDKYLSVDDMLAIKENKNGHGIEGENGVGCDGIELVSVDDGGDLVPPIEEGVLAEGLNANDYDPVYVYFKPANSFLFVEK